MKKTILTSLLSAGFALGVMAQGQVNFDNTTANASSGATATTGGLFWKMTGTGTVLETANTLNGALWGGSSASSLALLTAVGVTPTFTASAVLLDYFGTPGVYADDNGYAYAVSGVASGGTAFFQVQVWEGGYSSMAAAQAAGAYAGMSSVFSEAIGGGTATPPSLGALPAVVLTVPEPGTFALAGLGAAALLIFRRRK